MPVIYLKTPQNVRYTSAGGASVVFSPVSSIESKAKNGALFGATQKIKDEAPNSFELFFAYGMVPVKIAADHLVCLENFGIDSAENVGTHDCTGMDQEAKEQILTQLIDMEGFEDFLPFIKALSDGQKKTSLTTSP